MPLKPPGIFDKVGGDISTKSTVPFELLGAIERSGSSHSLVSTAATVTGDAQDEKLEELSTIPLSNAMQPAAAAVPKLAVEVARELRIEHLGDGHLKVHWPVDAKKLRGKDMQHISPSFEIYPGCSLKLMLKPKCMGNKKGQASFQKARGRGSVELKLVESVALAPTLRFCISVGGCLPRGPVEHDFSDGFVSGLAKNDDDFDFLSAVDPNSSTFLVCLEILPSDP